MADGVSELEARTERRRRNPKPPRNPPKGKEKPEEKTAQAQSMQEQRDEERRRREVEEAERARAEARKLAERRQEVQEQEEERLPASGGGAGKKRPTSIPFYPDPDNENFLWEIAQAAAARREKIPATAVLRLALRRLEQSMTPSEIVRELGGAVQSGGKMGRPRR